MSRTPIKHDTMDGRDALAIVNAYRERVHDSTAVEELEREFPYYAQELGLGGVWLANLADNDAGTFKWRGEAVNAVQRARTGRPTGSRLPQPYELGYGTVVDDVLRLQPDTQTIITPVVSGRLAIGILHRLAELRRTDILVIGAEAEGNKGVSSRMHANNLQRATVPGRDVATLLNSYESGRQELMRENTPHLAPAALVAIAVLRQQLHQGSTVVLGTGQREPASSPTQHTARQRMPI